MTAKINFCSKTIPTKSPAFANQQSQKYCHATDTIQRILNFMANAVVSRFLVHQVVHNLLQKMFFSHIHQNICPVREAWETKKRFVKHDQSDKHCWNLLESCLQFRISFNSGRILPSRFGYCFLYEPPNHIYIYTTTQSKKYRKLF